MRLTTVLAAVFATVGCCGSSSTVAPPSAPLYEVLDVVAIGPQPLEFYVHYTTDAAVLGFAITDDAGAHQYCPMYGSTYRGLPAVTLEVHAAESLEEVWVTSSWQGHESLAYHRIGSGSCVTGYGDHPLYSSPTPDSLGGGSATMPTLDPATTTLLGILSHDPDGQAVPRHGEPATQASDETSSVVRIQIRERLYVGWGALFPCDVSTLSGPTLPSSGWLGVAVGSGNPNCPLGFDVIEQQDQVTLTVVPGEQADRTCGLEVDVDSKRTYFKISALTPEP